MSDEHAHDKTIARVREWLREARFVTVFTGAGISTESGIPDFRGPQGIWTKNPEAEKMATIDRYVADPEVRKQTWLSRADSRWRAEPNTGHHALVDLERQGRLHALITQNIDGLHRAAGNSEKLLIEIHGNMREVVCLSCDKRAPMERTLERVRKGEDDPACRSCGGILKSATISFGQSLIAEDLQRSDRAARSSDLLIAIGSTLSVYPAAAVIPIAKESGARIVILNESPTEMDTLADCILRGSIGKLLPDLCADLARDKGPN